MHTCRCTPALASVKRLANGSLTTYQISAQSILSFPRYGKGARARVHMQMYHTHDLCNMHRYLVSKHARNSVTIEIWPGWPPKWAKSNYKQVLLNMPTNLWTLSVNRTYSLVDISFSKASQCTLTQISRLFKKEPRSALRAPLVVNGDAGAKWTTSRHGRTLPGSLYPFQQFRVRCRASEGAKRHWWSSCPKTTINKKIRRQ